MKNVTLKDVARAAGVSYSTVSRSLSGSPQIGRETRERILRLCDEMGYTKNYVARSMVMRRTELIGLVVPSIDNQFMAELAYHAEMSARARGYNLMLCNSGPDLRQEKAVVKLLVGRQVDGMLIVPQEHQSCEELRVYTEQVPTVFLSEDLRDEPLSCVTTDNTGATYHGIPAELGAPGDPVLRPQAHRHPPAAGRGLPAGLPGYGADTADRGQQLSPLLSGRRL